MEIETVPIGELIFDPENSRDHPEENLNAIAYSLEKFGQVLPLLVQGRVVIAGNGTLLAMKRLGFTHAKVCQYHGQENIKALAIVLNRTAELAQWHPEQLGMLLLDLADQGYAPINLGFSVDNLEAMFPEPDYGMPKKKTSQAKTRKGFGMQLVTVCPECGHEFTPSGNLDNG